MHKCTAIIKASKNFIGLYQPANLERVDLNPHNRIYNIVYTNGFSASRHPSPEAFMKRVWMFVALLRR